MLAALMNAGTQELRKVDISDTCSLRRIFLPCGYKCVSACVRAHTRTCGTDYSIFARRLPRKLSLNLSISLDIPGPYSTFLRVIIIRENIVDSHFSRDLELTHKRVSQRVSPFALVSPSSHLQLLRNGRAGPVHAFVLRRNAQ